MGGVEGVKVRREEEEQNRNEGKEERREQKRGEEENRRKCQHSSKSSKGLSYSPLLSESITPKTAIHHHLCAL